MPNGSIELSGCSFEAIPKHECPSDADLGECSSEMATDTLCEADQALPDGTSNYDIDNCSGYDVFRCRPGKIAKNLFT